MRVPSTPVPALRAGTSVRRLPAASDWPQSRRRGFRGSLALRPRSALGEENSRLEDAELQAQLEEYGLGWLGEERATTRGGVEAEASAERARWSSEASSSADGGGLRELRAERPVPRRGGRSRSAPPGSRFSPAWSRRNSASSRRRGSWADERDRMLERLDQRAEDEGALRHAPSIREARGVVGQMLKERAPVAAILGFLRVLQSRGFLLFECVPGNQRLAALVVREGGRWQAMELALMLGNRLRSCNLLLREYRAAGRSHSALWFLREMGMRGIRADRQSYEEVMAVLGRRRQWREADEVWERMQRGRVQPSIEMFNNRINASPRDARRALRIYEEMQRADVIPDVVTFSILLKVATASSSAGMSMAQRLLHDMRIQGIEHDIISYTTLIQAYAREGNADKAFKVWEELHAAGLIPAPHTWVALLTACAKGGQPERAQRVFEDMRNSGIPPSVRHYSVLMEAFALARQEHRAFSLFDLMCRGGVAPDVPCFNILIRALARFEYEEHPEAQVEEGGEGGGSSADTTTTTGASGELFVGGRRASLDGALTLMEEMRDYDLRPDATTWTILVNAAAECADHVRAEAIFGRMQADCAANENAARARAARKRLANFRQQRHATRGRLPSSDDSSDDNNSDQWGEIDDMEQRERQRNSFWERALDEGGEKKPAVQEEKEERREGSRGAMSFWGESSNRSEHQDQQRASDDEGESMYDTVPAEVSYHPVEASEMGDTQLWTALLKAHIRARNIRGAFYTYDRMLRAPNAKPNSRTFHTLLQACCRTGDMERAMRLYQDMRAAGIHANDATLEALVGLWVEQAFTAPTDGKAQPGLTWLNAHGETDRGRRGINVNDRPSVDVRGMMVKEARAVVLCLLRSLRERYEEGGFVSSPFCIVTGRAFSVEGVNSIHEAMLELMEQLDLPVIQPGRNATHLLVPINSLERWIRRGQQRRGLHHHQQQEQDEAGEEEAKTMCRTSLSGGGAQETHRTHLRPFTRAAPDEHRAEEEQEEKEDEEEEDGEAGGEAEAKAGSDRWSRRQQRRRRQQQSSKGATSRRSRARDKDDEDADCVILGSADEASFWEDP